MIPQDNPIYARLKNKIERELIVFLSEIDKSYCLSRLSPLIFKSIKNFVLRDGKRVRPILFVVGYLGFAKRTVPGLYASALSIELLHDFMLVHDDIIDRSDMRRGKPSMHTMLNGHLKGLKNVKFNGQDLSIVIGDVMYAMAIRAFLSIDEDMERKEEALKRFIEAAIYTGSGEFLELMYGVNDVEKITREDIYKVYDFKTAYYTFACPLATGAILAGASASQVKMLSDYGLYVGRAFQIADDVLGMFFSESKIGKSALTDLKEAKKTVLIWYAYRNAGREDKLMIKRILSKKDADEADLLVMRRIMRDSGALDYAKNEIGKLLIKSQKAISSSRMKPQYKTFLKDYARRILEQ